MLPYLLSFFGGYLVGSFPTGYLLVKRKSEIDITKAGSGNVGAFNASVVTGSRLTGIMVGLIDGFKGLVVVAALQFLTKGFWLPACGLIAAILGHNYPVWLKFKGGRGLATACGGLFGIGLSYILVWCTIWAIMKWQRQTILGANLIATLVTPVVLVLVPATSLESLMILSGTADQFRLFALILSAVFVVSHVDGFPELKRTHGE